MSVVPDKYIDRVQFYETHLTPWAANAVAIGTTAGLVTDLTTKTTAARAAYDAQQSVQAAAKAATLTLKTSVAAMGLAGAAIINQIRAKAASGGDGVYALAQIPAPAVPAPVGRPGTPTGFEVALNGDGALGLKWKCANPAGSVGTIYQVWRRINGTGTPSASATFDYLGGSGTKSFNDATVPAGSAALTYQIQAVRSTATGPWAQFNVNLGMVGGAGGSMTASVEPMAMLRKAA